MKTCHILGYGKAEAIEADAADAVEAGVHLLLLDPVGAELARVDLADIKKWWITD